MLTMIGTLIPWRGKVREDDENGTETALTRFHSEIDRLFDRFFSEPIPSARFGSAFRWEGTWPSVDISEKEGAVVVTAEVPGITADDLDISVSGDVLTISGRKQEESEERREGLYHSERRFGSFRRSIPLPASVDREKITAECADGVLTIRLPKSEETLARRIPVSASKTK